LSDFVFKNINLTSDFMINLIFMIDLLKKRDKLEKIPCATLLVRIRKAALSDDGRRSLSIKEFEEKDWIKKGLFEPRPSYSQAVYNTQFIQLTEPESGLFVSRKARVDQNVEELIYLIDKNLVKFTLNWKSNT